MNYSVKMIIAMERKEKKQKLNTLILILFRTKKPSIRYLAKVIETLISCMVAAVLGSLFNWYLKNDKVGNFDALSKIINKEKLKMRIVN